MHLPTTLAGLDFVLSLLGLGRVGRRGRVAFDLRLFDTFAFAAGSSLLALFALAQSQLLACHASVSQRVENSCWHPGGQVNRAERAVNRDGADGFAVDSRFVSDGSDNIAWLDSIAVADFDAIALHAIAGRSRGA